ncbi:TetR family transcriptional regulator [Berryella wangjianweii]|uniref:TetR family transcriptional regulator n=1 Tax=Berryella wangjianweii TaxID=2734634 RepID=A0A6M8J2K1_9ACTN|nr:TetR family transcriptional regulator [Berryella wangjianweii]QKF07837.1 TetR family transcriptional regulator [Berryella wangjianweii]
MSAMNTMLLIANAFVELCDETPLQKVSISDIVKRTGKNRKTFYYHFMDKNYLIAWIFRYDLALALRKRFPEETLVYEAENKDSMAQFPYYIRKKSGIRSLNHSEFYGVFASVLEARRRFYAQALDDNGPDSLQSYLFQLYQPAIKSDIEFILSGRYLPESNIAFLSELNTGAFLYYFIRKCNQPAITHLIADAGPFANVIHSSLETSINEVQLSRGR